MIWVLIQDACAVAAVACVAGFIAVLWWGYMGSLRRRIEYGEEHGRNPRDYPSRNRSR